MEVLLDLVQEEVNTLNKEMMMTSTAKE